MTMTSPHPGAIENATLAANLRALGQRNALVAQQVERATARAGVAFIETPQGLSATVDGRSLASRRKPMDEAARLVETIDLASAGAFVFLGFGLGHHVAQFAKKAGRRALIVVFEPDVALLRAVLERVDHSEWIATTNTVFLTGGEGGAIGAAIEGAEPMLAMGVKFVEHPPSKQRLEGSSGPFVEAFTGAMQAVRTVVVTTMVQTETTLRNALANLPHYLRGAADSAAGIADLKDLCAGHPAVVVSAGPSLAKNIDELARAGLRDRCVIIAVQTALKPLLARGIRPHFVTALDYHEISRRFYEGIDAEALTDVTLVVEPKAHPSVPNAFCGAIRCPQDENLDALLGEELAGEHGRIKAGSTVAHLAYYLARHLGCSPIALVGQDLAFTDGQYYGAGAAIHETWAAEVNPFTTLEMFEWERIVRGRATLRSGTDVQGKPVYTDEQMWTYHSQFEREFLADGQAGVEIIDASEGGLAKAHTTAMTLGDALERIAPMGAPALPEIAKPGARGADAKTLERARKHVASVRRDVGRIAALSRDTARRLARMRERLGDDRAVEKIIKGIYANRDEATSLQPAYEMTQRLNQTGAFNRARADREIDLAGDLPARERQSRQIERDIRNVEWLADSADALASMLDDALARLRGETVTRPVKSVQAGDKAREARLAGVVLDEARLDAARLQAMVGGLGACEGLVDVLVLTDDEARTRRRLGQTSAAVIAADLSQEFVRLDRMRRLRAFSSGAWRGGVAALTWLDEALAAGATLAAIDARGLSGAFVVDARREGLDPALCEQVIARHGEDPDARALAFSQAAPGLCGMVLDRSLLADIVSAQAENSPFASVGGVLRYNPRRPGPDPIGRRVCVNVAPEVRNRLPEVNWATPSHLVLELTTQRHASGGLRAQWFGAGEQVEIDAEWARAVVRSYAEAHSQSALTLAGRGDPTCHPAFDEIVRAAREAGVYALHVRTDLATDEGIETLRLADVVSVDLLATSAQTYALLTGSDAYEAISERFQRMCAEREFVGGLAAPWLVPRMTRCEATLGEIERFYDVWTALVGGAVIDPAPAATADERVAPLGLPDIAMQRLGRTTMCVRADGSIVNGVRDWCEGETLGRLGDDLGAAWRKTLAARGVERAS